MRLDATLSAIRQGGSEKSRILHEMLYADLGIKDIRITGSKDEPIISALHTLDPGTVLPRDSGFLWGWNRSAHSGSSPASGCGWPLWNPGLCWSWTRSNPVCTRF